jgi:hypothetical protein
MKIKAHTGMIARLRKSVPWTEVGLITALLLCAAAPFLLSGTKNQSEAAAEEQAEAEPSEPQTFLRPGSLRRGGTYEVHLDVDATYSFNDSTLIDTGTMNIIVLGTRLRNPQGMSFTLGISASQRAGLVPLTFTTPLAEGKTQVFTTQLKVTDTTEALRTCLRGKPSSLKVRLPTSS